MPLSGSWRMLRQAIHPPPCFFFLPCPGVLWLTCSSHSRDTATVQRDLGFDFSEFVSVVYHTEPGLLVELLKLAPTLLLIGVCCVFPLHFRTPPFPLVCGEE